MTVIPRGRIEMALRERLEMAGCHPLRDGIDPGAEIWFTPHLNREFIVPYPVVSAEGANKVLRAAGMEQSFRPRPAEPRPTGPSSRRT
jgi:hypothetical protein